MAIVSVIIGGLVGFATFLCTMVLTDASLMQALANYAIAGCGASGLLIGVALLRAGRSAATWRNQAAGYGPHQPTPDASATV